MAAVSETLTKQKSWFRSVVQLWDKWFSEVPLLAWLLSALVSAILEHFVGNPFAQLIGMPKAPVLFGFLIALKTPALFPPAILYNIVIYAIPVLVVAKIIGGLSNRVAQWMMDKSVVLSTLVHVILLYLVLQIWADLNDYRVLVLKLTLIAIMVTLSLNVINGYMGEFSCSHPGFMAVGAYAASILTIILFVNNDMFGSLNLPAFLAPFVFPIVLIISGLISAAGALLVAIPSFRTRGDYLAIISLAFTFIIKSLIENLEVFGGPRGLSGQPDLSSLPVVFVWTMLCIWIINNYVTSTFGKTMNAVRDGEMAANAMSINTRRTKMVTFLFAAFWAGVAGGLLAHVLRYVNPGSFGIQKLAEVLAMVYFGGLNSVVGAIVGAVGMNMLSEALRPLEIYKWIIIPVMIILIMIYRPTGLIAFREFDVKKLIRPKQKKGPEA
ncbi:MAG: branched-chain amino acid ABC transporter permease [Anaerolineales bacterium]